MSYLLPESVWKFQWFKIISEPFTTMNFAQAARGTLTRDGMLREIDSQSEIELGRHLDAPEKAGIFSRFPLESIVRCIDKVCYFLENLIYLPLTCISMGLVHLSFYSFWLRDLS